MLKLYAVWFNAGNLLNGGNYINDCHIVDDKLWLLEGPWVGKWLNAINEGEVRRLIETSS